MKGKMTMPTEEEFISKTNDVFALQLTRYQLLHLRDVMSVMLPSDMRETISQALAKVGNRSMVEQVLWNKIVRLCIEADVPVGDVVPDYIVSISAPATLGVFELQADPQYEGDGPEPECENAFSEACQGECECCECEHESEET
jgi:hypothetical protein